MTLDPEQGARLLRLMRDTKTAHNRCGLYIDGRDERCDVCKQIDAYLLSREGQEKPAQRFGYPPNSHFPEKCKGCGRWLLMENLYTDDGCPCNTPRGVNFTPQPCAICRTDNCVKPGHRLVSLFGEYAAAPLSERRRGWKFGERRAPEAMNAALQAYYETFRYWAPETLGSEAYIERLVDNIVQAYLDFPASPPPRPEVTTWVVVDAVTNRIECQRCGKSSPVPIPCPVSVMVAFLDSYGDAHRNCQPK